MASARCVVAFVAVIYIGSLFGQAASDAGACCQWSVNSIRHDSPAHPAGSFFGFLKSEAARCGFFPRGASFYFGDDAAHPQLVQLRGGAVVWEGPVALWDSDLTGCTGADGTGADCGHGRRGPTSSAAAGGQWAVGDALMLKAAFDAN